MAKCEWCGAEQVALYSHHHPVQKQYGGTETVNICLICHKRVHNGMIIIDATEAENKEAIDKIVERRLLDGVRYDFPLLWERGSFFMPYQNRLLVLTPPWKWKCSMPIEKREEILKTMRQIKRDMN